MEKNCPEFEQHSKSAGAKMLNQCVDFIEQTGIKVYFTELTDACFLPGLSIESGNILVDTSALKYPGDILHEAGHIAVVPSADRVSLDAETIGSRENHAAEEMMAIAWSYAACVKIGLDEGFVFHDGGYKGGGAYIADAFTSKQYFGLPMLQWMGLTADEKNAKILGIQPYPHMIKWLCD